MPMKHQTTLIGVASGNSSKNATFYRFSKQTNKGDM